MKNVIFCALVAFASSLNVYASNDGVPQSNLKTEQISAPETLKLVGEISDPASGHTTRHKHNLKIKNLETGESYKIVDSPELVKIHHENEKNYLVEIEAEVTSRFLFWGGNLTVKNFKVIDEIASVPHFPATEREFGRLDRP